MRIDVTADDLRQGIAGDCRRCPIALALFRATGQTWRVGGLRAENEDGGRVILPREADKFQTEFDEPEPGWTPVPFSFDITDQYAVRR